MEISKNTNILVTWFGSVIFSLNYKVEKKKKIQDM